MAIRGNQRSNRRQSERQSEAIREAISGNLRLSVAITSSSPITSTWTKVSSERGIVDDGSFARSLASSLVGSVGTSLPVERNGAVLSTCMLVGSVGTSVPSTDRNQRQSEAIRGNQRQSEAIRGNQRQSEAISGHERTVDRSHAKARGQPPRTSQHLTAYLSREQWRRAEHLHAETGLRPFRASLQRAVAVAALSTAPVFARLVRVASTTSSMLKSSVTAASCWACSPSEMP